MTAKRNRALILGGYRLVTWLVIILTLTGCEKARLDAQVRELCAKDGGVRIYQAVPLSAEQFDKWGMVRSYDPTQGENALGPDYIFRREIHYYREGNPEMSRRRYQVVRRSDGKVLGESVVYGRGGGDLPGPWHDSSFNCPDLEGGPVNTLLRSVFVQKDSGSAK